MKKRQIQFIAVSLIAALFTTACGSDSEPGTERDNASVEQSNNSAPISIPQFNRDSAFVFVEQQVNFGPRNPGSDGIEKTRDWLESKLSSYGANVIRQAFTANIYTGESYSSENIIGQFNPDNSRRVLLAAHYDTRFMGEEDTDPSMMSLPIPGADDGASGVGVLLEIARLIHENGIDLGVDIVFFDAEDQGQRGGGQNTVETWCLGSQYWARNPHVAGYSATFGILLDMVGSRNAFFNKENVGKLFRHSSQVHDLYNKVWNLARAMGKGRYFQNRTVEGIVDDHFFVNRDAGIPMIDIINKPPQSPEGFGEHWHTHQDDIDIIDKNTLGSVGQVVIAVIYREAAGKF